jgi:hydrogenase maturation protein HypF
MRLESAINTETDIYYPFSAGRTVMFEETIRAIVADMNHLDKSVIAARFHNTVAQAILEVSELMRNETSIEKVVLSGGVFQNKYLLEKTTKLLTQKMFMVYTNHQVPVNDGGISLGQLVAASKKSVLCA